MSAVLFVREDLLKATHKELKWIESFTDKHGHVHRGHHKHVLVADNHENVKVAAGQGSFYQKIAHKNAMADIPNFQSLDIGHQTNIILHNATKLQAAASASAALSGFKTSMLAGKVPTTAQYLAMVDAPSKAQAKVIDACVAAIGDEKYEQLLFAASAKANQTKGKVSEPKTVEASQKEQAPVAPAALAPLAVNPAKSSEVGQPGTPGQAAVEAELPPNVKQQLDDWATDGYVDRLQDAVDDHGSHPAYQAYAKKLLVQFQPIKAAVMASPDFSAMANAPVPENIKAVIDKVASLPTGDLEGAKLLLGQVVANNAHNNPHIAAYAQAKLGELSKIPASPPKSAIPLHTFTGDGLESYVSHGTGKMAGKFSVSLKDTDAGQFVPSVTFYPSEDAAIKSAKSAAGVKDGPKEGDTKPGADGSNLVFKNGRWHKYVNADEHGELPPVLVPVADGAPSLDEKMQAVMAANVYASASASVAAMEGGSHYQKEAVKKLKAEHGPAWAAMHPTQQLDLAHAKYQALQGAASQAAAVSGWKKHMLAGQVPTPSEVKALATLASQDAKKVGKLMADVQDAIGGDKLALLVAQAHAKMSKAPVAAPAKVFVTTPPPAVGPGVHPAATPSAAAMADLATRDPAKAAKLQAEVRAALGGATNPVNEALSKFSGNTPVKEFIQVFKIHGGPAAGGLSIDQLLDPDQIEAFQKLDSLGKMDVAAAVSFYGLHKLKLFAEWLVAQNSKSSAPAAPAGPVPVTSDVYTNTQPGHNKFWSVSTHGKYMTTTYGKIGAKGSTTTKEFASPDAAVIAADKLKGEKVANGYKYGSKGAHQYEVAAAKPPLPPATTAADIQMLDPNVGPKDGDTKQGADGTLVFKDGHWHKQGISLPDFSDDSSMWGGIYTKSAVKLKDAFEAGGAAAVKKMITVHKVGKKAGKFSCNAGYGKFCVGPGDTEPRRVKMFAFITAMLESKAKGGGKVAFTTASPTAVPQPAAQPVKAKPSGAKVFVTKDSNAATGDAGPKNGLAAPKLVSVQDVISSNVADIGGWKKTGEQEGSNTGGYYTDPDGQQWYCKFPKDPDAAKSELLAIKLYAACGIEVPSMKAVLLNGKPGVASRVITGLKKSKDALASTAGTADGFAVDAWLANWDAVGLGFDNLQIKAGKAIRVDVGGSLDFRAQGGKKGAAFGSVVTELKSMRDAATNAQAAHVFGALTDAQIGASAKHIFKLKDTGIIKLCNAYGPGSVAEKHALAQKLIDRKKDLAAKFPDEFAEFAPKISVVLPMKPNFKEWNGPGKGLSSKAAYNDQNQEIVEQISVLAAKGNPDDLAAIQYQPITDAGAPSGPKVPVASHKSQHISKYLTDVVNAIKNPQAVMPAGLVDAQIDAGGGGIFGSLLSFFDDVKSLASSAYNLGRYAITGKVTGDGLFDAWQYTPKSMGNGKLSAAQHYKDSMANFKKLPQTQQDAIKAYTGSAYHTMNNPLTGVGTHGSTDFAIDGIDKASIPLEEGTVLSRKFSFANDSGGNLQKLMQSEGCLLKDFGIISTAMTPGTWSGAVQLHITCAEGVRGLFVAKNPSGGGSAISSHASENEIILPYGTKFFVKKVHKQNHSFKDEHGSWSAGLIVEVIALPN